MKKTYLLAAATLALSSVNMAAVAASRHSRPPTTMLWNQNSNFGEYSYSDNFTSGSFSSFDDSGADDFVVPAGKTWKITGVDVTGNYGSCCPPGVTVQVQDCGPATSEIITFYKNKGGLPGAVIGTAQTINCTDNMGNFTCSLPTSVKLRGGTKGKTYWLGFVANMNFNMARQWYWTFNTTVRGNVSAWENPGGGFGFCPTWSPNTQCFGYDDYAFDLRGRSR
jgi:opacity protein-like surface antigen